VHSLWLGSTELIVNVDYTIGVKVGNTRYFTINSAFLSSLSPGTHSITLRTHGGMQDFVLTVLQRLSTSEAILPFNQGDPQDVTMTLEGYPLMVSSVAINGVILDSALTTFDNGILTIANAAFLGLAYGEHSITLNNSLLNSLLVITVTDTRNSVLLSEDLNYVLGSNAPVNVDFNLYANSFDGLLYQNQLVSTDQFQWENNRLVLSGTYLESIVGEQATLTFVFRSTPDLEIVIDVDVVVELPTVLLQGEGYAIDGFDDVAFLVDLKGHTFDAVGYLGALIDPAAYQFNAATGILTISHAYLASQYHYGDTALELSLLTVETAAVGLHIPYPNASMRIWNGGFETADLTGWMPLSIWKNETPMMAWQDARVVDGTYFSSYPYNRDGSYNLGIVWNDAPWDQSSERMGHLISAPFVLGGSGWISFKLGGGRNSSFAYVSVRRTTDHVEVARFGNRHFNDTALATSQFGSAIANAEAFLFQYYFDLSSVGTIGTSYYITLTDAAGFDWSILSADSFATYYASVPTTTSDTVAMNIVPAILHVDTAANVILNGSFDNQFTDWQNVNNAWGVVDGSARSNPQGDINTGLLRSSAFTVAGNPYLRLDWAGGLKWDKQIFISVKEVGTNIEVLRFVVRANVASKEGSNFDNHMLDLSSLDVAKKYYLEFADNRTASWGVSFVDAIRFVPLSEWNSVTTGDRAVSISGITTNYTHDGLD
jgi:hypothetical protein